MENILDNAGQTIFYEFPRTDARGQGHSDPKTHCDTLRPQDVSTYQILDSYLKINDIGDNTVFIELRTEVNLTVILKQFSTLYNPNM